MKLGKRSDPGGRYHNSGCTLGHKVVKENPSKDLSENRIAWLSYHGNVGLSQGKGSIGQGLVHRGRHRGDGAGVILKVIVAECWAQRGRVEYRERLGSQGKA